jgi:hypothetical protein
MFDQAYKKNENLKYKIEQSTETKKYIIHIDDYSISLQIERIDRGSIRA